MVTPPPLWSTILQEILRSSTERQRLAQVLGVTPMTLNRWANGESRPQRNHVLHLVQAVHPQHRHDLILALEPLYPEISTWLKEDTSDQIPSDFYALVLSMRTTTTETLRFWRITESVLRHALTQLDPSNLGMAIKLVQCMPPGPGGKVLSLRECTGKGTPPWSADLEQDVLFLGVESLCGYCIETRKGQDVDDLSKSYVFPYIRDTHEASAAVFPVRFEGKIAGCLLASSTQLKHFTAQRMSLMGAYSDLVALAFDQNEFYAPEQIELRALPSPNRQRPILATFRRRVTTKSQENIGRASRLENSQIEREAWQEIENELLSMPPE